MINKVKQREIKKLMQKAGGVREVARQCEVNYDTFWNVMRGNSPRFETVQKMIDRAKEIVAEKENKPAVII